MVGQLSLVCDRMCILPVDILHAHTGVLLAEMTHPDQRLICPINAIHPTLDVIASGASGHIMCWRYYISTLGCLHVVTDVCISIGVLVT